MENHIQIAITILSVTGVSLAALYAWYEIENWILHPVQSTVDTGTAVLRKAPDNIEKNLSSFGEATQNYWHQLTAAHSEHRVLGAAGILTTGPRMVFAGVTGLFGIKN